MQTDLCLCCQSPSFAAFGSKGKYDFWKCATCGFVATRPLPSYEELERIYSNYEGSRIYEGKRNKKIRRTFWRLRRLLIWRPARSFIDVGCSLGFAVAAATKAGLDAHGIDLDADAVARAKVAFGAEKFRLADVREIAAAGETYDIVHCSEVIEHSIDPAPFAAALAQLVAPGGVLFLTTPDAGHPRVPRDFTSWNEVQPPKHLHLFTKTALRTLFVRLGFRPSFQWRFKPKIVMIARHSAIARETKTDAKR
jgi:2-polyprenyl-3-methyl-5-hydroxy-6-metoxy-1,4-benzoquinol methylase